MHNATTSGRESKCGNQGRRRVCSWRYITSGFCTRLPFTVQQQACMHNESLPLSTAALLASGKGHIIAHWVVQRVVQERF